MVMTSSNFFKWMFGGLIVVVIVLSVLVGTGVFDEQEVNDSSTGQNSTGGGRGIGGLFKSTIVDIPQFKKDSDAKLEKALNNAEQNTSAFDAEIIKLLGGSEFLPFVLTPEMRIEAQVQKRNIESTLSVLRDKFATDSVANVAPGDQTAIDNMNLLIADIVNQMMKLASLNRLLAK